MLQWAMSDVIDRIQRLRKLKERAAQMEWMASDAERREQEREVQSLIERMESSQQSVDGMRLSSLASHHMYVYNLEMRRRKEQGILGEFEEDVDEKQFLISLCCGYFLSRNGQLTNRHDEGRLSGWSRESMY